MMKFSEAIRLGATLKPQVFGQIVQPLGWRPMPGPCVPVKAAGPPQMIEVRRVMAWGTCALGAALDAIGRLQDGLILGTEWPLEWQEIGRAIQRAPCPECSATAGKAVPVSPSIVAHLNDTHRWPREAIADWVEALERNLEQREAAVVAAAEPAMVLSDELVGV